MMIIQALMAIGNAEQVDRVVIESLGSTNTLVRKNAVRGLPCGILQERFESLREMSVHEDAEFQRILLSRFGGCNVRSAQLLPDWMALLGSADVSDQREALRGLKTLGRIAEPAVGQIEQIARQRNESTLVEAAHALWSIAGRTDFLDMLIAEFATAENWMFLRGTLQLWGEMGPAAKKAVPVILVRCNGQNPNRAVFPPVLQAAREALEKIDPGSVEKLPKEEGPVVIPRLMRPPPPPSTMPVG
jgi:hypothetical protein